MAYAQVQDLPDTWIWHHVATNLQFFKSVDLHRDAVTSPG